MTPAEYQRRQAKLWRRAFFALLILSMVACLFFYFKGHVHGQQFMEKRAETQMHFDNLVAGAGSEGRYQDLEGSWKR